MKKILTDEQIEKAEKQLGELRKEIDYNTRDYSIDFIIDRYHKNEFFIPDEYQRKYIWKKTDKTRFIESILLGLPIPLMFYSDSDDGRCEIIDGAQRTQALEEFVSNQLELTDLKKLTLLNGFRYTDIPNYYRKKFDKTNMRVVVLTEETSLEIRQEIFNRINTTGRAAKPSEVRRGSYRGKFMDFLSECSQNPLFIKLCPISENQLKRYENLELVLRFFAYLYDYESFSHDVDKFLDKFVDEHQHNFDKIKFKKRF